MLLTPKIEKAIKRASELYDKGHKKAEHDLHYINHLFGVATILSEYADDEDVLIAGLLHDSLSGSEYSLPELQFEFGEIVAKTIEQVTSESGKKSEYLETLKKADVKALMVVAAIGLHRLQTLKKSLETEKEVKFLKSILKVLEDRLESPIIPVYRKALRKYEKALI